VAKERSPLSTSAQGNATDRKTLVVIDGMSLLYRAYYALPELKTRDGTPTQAVYGFALMLLRLLEEEAPAFVAVVTDRSGPTFRDELYTDYKANRPEMPAALSAQIPLFYQLVEALRIPVLGVEGFEADDCIGTIACRAREQGLRTVIVTGDRDLLQLVGPQVEVVLTRRGIRETERLDPRGVKELLGVHPHQVPDLKALTGDASDNIPGVPGVGSKTAVRWLEEFGTVDQLLERADAIRGKAGENLRAHADQVRLSRRLATIETDVPIEVDWEQLSRRDPDWPRLTELLERLEFHSLLRRLREKQPEDDGATAPQAKARSSPAPSLTVETPEDAQRLAAHLRSVDAVAVVPFLAGTHPLEVRVRGLAVAWQGGAAWVPVEGSRLPAEAMEKLLAAVCGDHEREVVVPDAKSLLHALRAHGVRLSDRYQDVGLASYLLHAGRTPVPVTELLGQTLGEDVAAPEWGPQATAYADAVRRAWPGVRERLRHDGLLALYDQLEQPLVAILAEMEATGIRVDASYLESMAAEMGARLRTMTEEIYQLAGESFNINSPRQLAAILYDKLGLPVLKRTKTGPSTDADVLEELAAHHSLPAALLRYRQVAKLMNTYVETLPRLVHPVSGRVHTTFNQTVTATGRLSSAHPNLQNIPVRTDEGRLIRGAFVAGSPDLVLITADYSQIELRVLAHLSGDERLLDAFRRGEDIHVRTASEVFGVPREQVTSAQRAAAKAINFGIVYGISSFGLARGTGLTQEEAQTYIDGYFERYPGVKAYLDRLVADAYRNGFVTTLSGRRRYLPELKSRQWARRQFAERTAMNTPIQGSAADIIKTSMVRLVPRLRSVEPRARLLLQVHDELVLECPRETVEPVARAVRDAMERAVPLDVPLVVEVRVGPNWKDTEPLPLDERAEGGSTADA